ncbi:hypothetical protein DXG01_007174 [Tephrocybe rancida]|nr:hypothetical protein DXG01_007174 [Tephrocybe rancida]
MAPINTTTTPQLRPPLQNNGHSRTSSFFSFRNKTSTPSQATGHPRSGSMGNGNGVGPGAGEFGTTTGPVQAPVAAQQQQQPSQPPPPQPTAAPQPLHPEIRSVVQLTAAHSRKIYYSGPLVRRVERRTADQKQKEEVWFEVWAQLNGTTLSIWDMAQIQEASKQGKEVPPTYVNTTDAFVQVHGSVTTPDTPTSPSKKYLNILALNTAGSNILLFSCPDARSLKSWAAAMRLSAWEKSRLEEIYTAHLFRIMLKREFCFPYSVNSPIDRASTEPDALSTLVRGRLEGWVRVRVAGQTDWKRMWMVVSAGTEGGHPERVAPSAGGIGSAPMPITALPPKKRMSSLFSRNLNNTSLPSEPVISMYTSQKPKDKKKALLTFKNVTQAFAVYPERPELISRSTLVKVEGTFGDEETAASMKTRQGWLLIMPELEASAGQAEEMLRWLIALHDAFELYGRPDAWTWDPRNPVSLMFAYPVGPNKDLLFLDRELAETLDPRDESTSSIRSRLIGILLDRMRGVEPPRPTTADTPPTLPPIGNNTDASQQRPTTAPAPQPVSNASGGGFQLPPLSFGGTTLPDDEKPLSPVRRQSNAEGTGSPYGSPQPPPPQNVYIGNSTSTTNNDASMFDRPVTNSPTPVSPPQSVSAVETSPRPIPSSVLSHAGSGRRSFDSPSINRGFQVPSRVDSTGSSASAFSKAESRPHDGLVSKSPLSSSTISHGNSSAAPALANSPPSYSTSSTSPSTSISPPASDLGPGPPLVTVPKRTMSVLTSPHSVFIRDDNSSQPSVDIQERGLSPSAEINDRASILTSPHSISGVHPTLTSPYSPHGTIRSIDGRSSMDHVSPPRSVNSVQPGNKSEDSGNLLSDAGALYYMQQHSEDVAPPRRVPTTINEQTDSDSDDDDSPHVSTQQNVRAGAVSPASNDSAHSRKQPVRQSTPMAFFERSSPIPSSNIPAVASADHSSPSRQGLGRKPSGARAQATARPFNAADGISSQQVAEEEIQSEDHYETPLQAKMNQLHARPSASLDADLDALAALSYLAVDDKPASPKQANVEPLHIQKTPPPGPIASETSQFKSSFAPSKQATERKAKAQAQQAAHHLATHKPGRVNGKRKSRAAGAWNQSSDDEEEEEEEDDDDDDDDDDDADSDAEPSLGNKQNSGPASSSTSLQHRQQQQFVEQGGDPQQYSQLRPPRSLPQVPGNNYLAYSEEEYNPPPRRMAPDQYSVAGGPMPRTLHDGTQIRTQAEFPQPGAARQNPWSQVLDPGRAANIEAPRSDTFVQLEPAQHMTKAFTPQGLLSAGIQDKQDRSAKRQEELARETGASLINVPNKPPPPQMGLLGAITAHERERKREGGVGAALTEREREKRVAEDRQRRFDDHQRQQLDQMQQGGSMYGGQFPAYGMNPMMMMNPMMAAMNPMMTAGGMNPMMTGGGMGGVAPMMTGQMGYPGMMPGYNPQHMFAAQQAAQAYQQAMMAFSVAGSQVGGEGAGATPPLNPAMAGGNMVGNMGNMGGGNMGFDPRMSMMGMPMMGQMGQMGQMAPMGMQMTGMSTFDPRFPPTNDSGLAPPTGFGGQDPASRNSSPARRSSPLARQTDSGGPSPRAESPKS